MTEQPRQDEDKPKAGENLTEEEREELQSGGNSAEVVESKDDDGPAKTPGA